MNKDKWIYDMYINVKNIIEYFSACLHYDLTYIKIYNEHLLDDDYKTYWALALLD